MSPGIADLVEEIQYAAESGKKLSMELVDIFRSIQNLIQSRLYALDANGWQSRSTTQSVLTHTFRK